MARTRVIPGRASSILLPSPRDFEISFAPSLEGEFSSPLKREGERNPLPIDRYFATMPRHGSPLPSLPPLSFACRYYERKQTGNWFDRRLFFFFLYRPVKNRWRIFSHSVDYCADCVAQCGKKLRTRNCVSHRGGILADDGGPVIGAERELKTRYNEYAFGMCSKRALRAVRTHPLDLF